ncbi:MAG: glutamine synthetase type III, partial [Oscillospiraceae bacterium]|nr:glutamine synthetase type III [Oscillospiraceae bacterium]
HRLGGYEAPPAVISLFLGEELSDILDAIESGRPYEGKERVELEIGADVLPHFPKDITDRNRTSPFAFTGNKFEFRMVGASFSVADANTVLNTAVAEVLCEFADTLEQSEKSGNFKEELAKVIKDAIKNHKRIIFNGNNYSKEWEKEAQRRGLLNLKTTVDALSRLIEEKNIKLYQKHKVFTESELRSRHEILLENYCNTVHMEALTFLEMAKRGILPSAIIYQAELADLLEKKQRLGLLGIGGLAEKKLLEDISKKTDALHQNSELLENALAHAKKLEGDTQKLASHYRDEICPLLAELREPVDALESLVAKKHWCYPTYGEILYSVN